MLCVLGSWALWAAPHRLSVWTDFISSLKGRKVRPAHCHRDSVGQDGSFVGDFWVSLPSVLEIPGAATSSQREAVACLGHVFVW